MSNTLHKDTKKRLVKDISDLYKHPLTNDGIYYIHDDTNMLKGYAMIIGPQDTIYKHSFFFFSFDFPTNYPYKPPKVTYHSNDGNTRFHPNLYRNGKVCLSILNTWYGEKWTSCQSIRSILLVIITLFDNNPLLHEPGITCDNKYIPNYNESIEYASLLFAYNVYSKKINYMEMFSSFIDEYFENNKNDILDVIKDKCTIPLKTNHTGIYNMTTIIDYNHLYKLYRKLIKTNI